MTRASPIETVAEAVLVERARIVRLLFEESDRLWHRATDDGWNAEAARVATEFDQLVERVERVR